MREIEAFVRSNQLFSKFVAQIQDNQWDAPTPNTEWNVRDLVAHVADENRWIPPMLGGKRIAEVAGDFRDDALGADPKAGWGKNAKAAEASINKLTDLGHPVHLSYGDAPASEYLQHMTIDHVIHSWDLARAIGADEQLDEKLIQTVYDWLEPIAESWRASGAFGPAVPTPPDASLQTKLLALSGREV